MTTWRRSSYTNNGTCVEVLRWRKSSYSNAGTCVELAEDGPHIAVRNSTRPHAGTLQFPAGIWSGFLAGVKAGEFG